MKDQKKTKAHLINELEKLRLQDAEQRLFGTEHKRAEEEFRNSVEKFRNFADINRLICLEGI